MEFYQKVIWFYFGFILFFEKCAGTAPAEPILVTKLGVIVGKLFKSDRGQPFQAFQGIPYALPPTESNRFQAPKLATGWNDTFYATREPPICLQVDETAMVINTSTVLGSEDCLFLNIYRNQKQPNEIFPVMVFVHGGGFMSGNGNFEYYGPQRFMDKNVVLVTFNYRLGPFGFLSTGDEAAPGNYGLLDTVLALNWVKRNIIDYGGDPSRVTIFGESAGASLVSLLILSPLAKGLFHAAIMQSGNALADWGFEYDSPLKETLKLATELKCDTSNNFEMIKCLRNHSAIDILTKSTWIPGTVFSNEPLYKFRPTVDSCRGTKAFLPHPPKQQLLKGDINIVPTISGTTRDEGIMFYLLSAMLLRTDYSSDPSLELSKLFAITSPNLVLNKTQGKEAIQQIQEKYLYNKQSLKDLKEKMILMNEIFGGDSQTAADNFNEILARRGSLVYVYKLAYRGKQSWLEIESKQFPENFIHNLQLVAHGDDLQYFFPCKYFKEKSLFGFDRRMAEILLSLWTNFATTKIPIFDEKSSDDVKQSNNYRWNYLNFNSPPEYLELNLKSKMVQGYLSDDRDFWNKIYNYEPISKK